MVSNLDWSSRGRVMHMSAEQAAVIRPMHLAELDVRGIVLTDGDIS